MRPLIRRLLEVGFGTPDVVYLLRPQDRVVRPGRDALRAEHSRHRRVQPRNQAGGPSRSSSRNWCSGRCCSRFSVSAAASGRQQHAAGGETVRTVHHEHTLLVTLPDQSHGLGDQFGRPDPDRQLRAGRLCDDRRGDLLCSFAELMRSARRRRSVSACRFHSVQVERSADTRHTTSVGRSAPARSRRSGRPRRR